jgi:predicted Zn-dependent peptidase
MTLQTSVISDSIRLSAIRTDRFKTGILTFSLTIPLTSKNFAYNTLLAGIMRRGTEHYPSLSALNKRLDELYASSIEIRSSQNAKNLSLIITAEFLDDRYIPNDQNVLSGVLHVISDLIFHPLLENGAFLHDIVVQEKRIALDYLKSEINNTRLYALKRCYERMYRLDDDYPSTQRLKQHIENADEKSIYQHFLNILDSSAIDVFYIGNENISNVSSKIALAFDKYYPKNIYTPIMPKSRPILPLLSESEAMPVSQGKLTLGFRTGACIGARDDKYYAALVFNEIFGASPLSKLFMNVREKLSLCYYCSSTYSLYSGDLIVSSGIEVKNREKAEREILHQLDNIRKGQISEAEFSAALRALENTYKQILDNPLDLQSFYATRGMFGIYDTIENTLKKILCVTVDDVIGIANDTHLDTVFFVEGTLLNGTDTEEEEYE